MKRIKMSDKFIKIEDKFINRNYLKKKQRKKFFILTDDFYTDLIYKFMYKYRYDTKNFNRLYSSKFRISSLIKTNKDYKYIHIQKMYILNAIYGIYYKLNRGYIKV